MVSKMLSCLEIVAGLLLWCGVLWDGFATIILPRTVLPMRHNPLEKQSHDPRSD
jgi:hypothetical protein